MTYAIEYFNEKTREYYLGDETFETKEAARDYYRFTQYRLSNDVSFSRIVELNEKECKKELVSNLTNNGKGYKIKFHNVLTGENTLSNEVYDTPKAAEEAWEKAFLAGEIPSDIACGGIFSIDNSEPNTPDGISEKKGGPVYELTDDGKGKKYDSGKSMAGTLCRVFPRALLGVGQCIAFGTKKYPKPDNWKLVENAFTRYQDSMIRHYLKFLAGREKDSETNLLHLKHMVWNALAVLELYLMENEDETLFD